MPDPTLAPPSLPPRPLRAQVEVHAGTQPGLPDLARYRRWEVHGAADVEELRLRLADRMTEAYYYAGQLPFPQELRWVTIACYWQEERP
jgi:hypothetical protein